MPSLNPRNPPSPPSFPPFHLIPGVPNFRDIGGWPILPPSNSHSQHYHVRTSLLYRGSDTNRITPAGIAKLVDLHIKTDFDLRSKQQIEKTGGYVDMREHGIERVWAPVFGEEEYSEERAGERYWLYASEDTGDIVSAFIEILLAGAPMFHTALTHLLSTIPPQSPSSSQLQPPAIFLHCTTGNNRTGVFIALLLLLLHVPHPSIIAEYTLSDLGLAPTRHINVERLLKKGAFGGLSEEERKRKCERMVGARGESMQALLREVQERWGVDGEGYFRDVVGLTGEEVERLREVFTVEGPAETGVGYEV